MIRAYRYRFYPSRDQAESIQKALRLCCHLYNAAVEQRRYFLKDGHSIGYLAQQNQLPDIKRGIPEYKQVYSQVLQDALHRVDRAFTSFFERVGDEEMAAVSRQVSQGSSLIGGTTPSPIRKRRITR